MSSSKCCFLTCIQVSQEAVNKIVTRIITKIHRTSQSDSKISMAEENAKSVCDISVCMGLTFLDISTKSE